MKRPFVTGLRPAKESQMSDAVSLNPKVANNPARRAKLERLVADLVAERLKQIYEGKDAVDSYHTPLEWVGIMVRHLGLAAGDCDVPIEPKRFRKQMVILGALAMAALEYHDDREAISRPVTDTRHLDKIPNSGDNPI